MAKKKAQSGDKIVKTSKSLLPNVNVYATKDKATTDFLNTITRKGISDKGIYAEGFNIPVVNSDEDYSSEYYNSIWKSWLENGKPKIRKFEGRANFDPHNNILNIPYNQVKTFHDDKFVRPGLPIDAYFAELAHAKQKLEGKNLFSDRLKYPDEKEYDKKAYTTPGDIEYEAHQSIEQELEKKYRNIPLLSEDKILDIAKNPYKKTGESREDTLNQADLDRISKQRTLNYHKANKEMGGKIKKKKAQLGQKLNIDSTLSANKHVPFVDRILNADKYPTIQLPNQPSPSTHLMMQVDNYAVPQLRYVDGKWINNTNPDDAINAGDAIKFKNDADALYFTENYKNSKLSKLDAMGKKKKAQFGINDRMGAYKKYQDQSVDKGIPDPMAESKRIQGMQVATPTLQDYGVQGTDPQSELTAGLGVYNRKEKPKPIDWSSTLAAGFLAVDALIPGEEIKNPVVRPKMGYNPYQYGTGSQAIAKSGKKISTTGYKRNSKDKNEPSLRIPSNQITMKGVDFPVLGVSDTGDTQYMVPGADYTYDGSYVDEFPLAKDGGIIQKFGKGGKLSMAKAKEMLRDGTANGKKLTARQKRYFGFVAGGGDAQNGASKLRQLADVNQYDVPGVPMQNAPIDPAKLQSRNDYAGTTKSVSDFYYLNPLTSSGSTDPKSSFQMRKWRAENLFDIPNYKGTAKQNAQLLKLEQSDWNGAPDYQYGGAVENPLGNTPRVGTPQEREQANLVAQRLAAKHNLMDPTNTTIGQYLPEFLDEAGRPARPMPTKKLPTNVPDYVKIDDLQRSNGQLGYEDYHTGDWTPVDDSVITLPRFNRSPVAPDRSVASRQNGGYAENPLGNTPRVGTAKEREQATLQAQRLGYKHGLMDPSNMQIGEYLPQYVTPSGQPYQGAPKKQLPTKLPQGVGISDIQNYGDEYGYEDPHTGDWTPVDPTVVNNPMFKKPAQQVATDLMGRSTASRKYGGPTRYNHGGSVNPISSRTSKINGPSHVYGGVPFMGIEAEGGETAFKSVDGSVNIMGNMINPITGRKFKADSTTLAKKEAQMDKLMDYSIGLVNEADIKDKYDVLKFNSGRIQFEGAAKKKGEINESQEHLATIQQAMLEYSEEMGIDPGSFSKGYIQKAKPSNKAEYGKKIAQYGASLEDDEFITQLKKGIGMAESSGNYFVAARAKGSTAYGRYQFTQPTRKGIWAKHYKGTYKDFAKFDADYRSSPQLQEDVMTNHLTDLRAKYGDDPQAIALVHRLGPGGYNNIKKDPSLMDKSVFKSVPDSNDKETPGQYLKKLNIPAVTNPKLVQPPQEEYTPTGDFNYNPNKPNFPGAPAADRVGRSEYDTTVKNPINYNAPTDARGLSITQILPELYAAATNQVEPVFMQEYEPQLYQDYEVSFQDQLNENQATFSALSKAVGNDPSTLSVLAAQKYSADSSVLANEFRTNQAIEQDVVNKNISLLNDAELKNIGLADTQFVRQSTAKSKTKAQNQLILNSISDKVTQNIYEQRLQKTYENLYPNYRFGEDYKTDYYGPTAGEAIQLPGTAPALQPIGDAQVTVRTDAKGNVSTSKKYQSSIQKQLADIDLSTKKLKYQDYFLNRERGAARKYNKTVNLINF